MCLREQMGVFQHHDTKWERLESTVFHGCLVFMVYDFLRIK